MREGTRLRAVVEGLDTRRLMTDVLNASVNAAQTYQTIDAIGAATASASQYSGYRQASFYNNLVSDLGITAVRSALEPGWEPTNAGTDPTQTDLSKFNDSAIANTMQFFQQMKARGVNTFLLSVFSAPAWMKTDAATSNGGQLRPDMRSAFAEFITSAILQAKQKYGVTITQVSIANEPYFTESYNSMVWTPDELTATIKAVATDLQAAGLTTQIVAPEEVSSLYREQTYLNTIDADPAANADVPIWGTHYIDQQDGETLAAAATDAGKKIWYTEVGDGSADISGALGIARGIDSALVSGDASAWFNWQITGSNSNEALMNGTTPNIKYYALKQFAHFIRPGMVRIGVNYTGDSVRVSAFKAPDNSATTIVLSNDRTTDVNVQISLSGMTIPAQFQQYRTSATENCVTLNPITGAPTITVTLPANSIVTLYSGPALPVVTNTTAATPTTEQNATGAYLTDALHTAAFTGQLNMVNQLIADGADVNSVAPNGWTPLFEAAASPYNRADQIITALLQAGADPLHVDNEGFTALHVAAMSEIPAYGTASGIAANRINLLLAAGVNVNAVDNYGRTALDYAAMLPKLGADLVTQDTSPIQALLNGGADTTIKDDNGLTAFDWAEAEGATAAVPLLSATGSLSVTAFSDINQNGVLDPGEAALANVGLFVDLNNDGVEEAGEPTATTDSTGAATFSDLPVGTYSVLPVTTPANYTAPTPPAKFSVTANMTTTGALPFTPVPVVPPTGTASIAGYVINDLNGNGASNSGEPVLAGRTVWIDLNNNGVIDPGEPQQVTTSGGKFLFSNLAAGKYTVRDILPTGWQQTGPASGAYVDSVSSGQSLGGNTFCEINVPPPPTISTGTASIHAYVVNDTNKDGKWSSGEVGITGRTVWIDLNNNGVLDAGEPTQTTGANGAFTFANLAAGTYDIRQVLPTGWTQTSPTGNAALVITLIDGQQKSGNSLETVEA